MRGLGFVFMVAAIAGSAWAASVQEQRMKDEAPLVRFGLVADCQYEDRERDGIHFYRETAQRLKAATEAFNEPERGISFAIHLGDFINTGWESFAVVGPIWGGLKPDHYHVLGNHDFDVPDERKGDVTAELGMPANYYAFDDDHFAYIVLNGNEESIRAHPKGSLADAESHKAFARYQALGRKPRPWEGGLGAAQLKWLGGQLARAWEQKKRVFLFCHMLAYPRDEHNLWDAPELLEIIDRHPNVIAFFNGHRHLGAYGFRRGVHYVTMMGMLDTTALPNLSKSEIGSSFTI